MQIIHPYSAGLLQCCRVALGQSYDLIKHSLKDSWHSKCTSYQSMVCLTTVRCKMDWYEVHPHKIHSIACPLEQEMGHNLWFGILTYILLQSMQCCMKYRIILYCIITALDCMLYAIPICIRICCMNMTKSCVMVICCKDTELMLLKWLLKLICVA